MGETNIIAIMVINIGAFNISISRSDVRGITMIILSHYPLFFINKIGGLLEVIGITLLV